MRKTGSIILAALLLVCLGLSGCTKYISSYHAVAFVHSNDAMSARMNFYEFEGTKVFKLKGKGEKLSYSAELESGKMIIQFDMGGKKEVQLELSGGMDLAGEEEITGKGIIYVIITSTGSCQNGDFQFTIEP